MSTSCLAENLAFAFVPNQTYGLEPLQHLFETPWLFSSTMMVSLLILVSRRGRFFRKFSNFGGTFQIPFVFRWRFFPFSSRHVTCILISQCTWLPPSGLEFFCFWPSSTHRKWNSFSIPILFWFQGNWPRRCGTGSCFTRWICVSIDATSNWIWISVHWSEFVFAFPCFPVFVLLSLTRILFCLSFFVGFFLFMFLWLWFWCFLVSVTNSETGWVQMSAQKFMPPLVPFLSHVTISSARSAYEARFPGMNTQGKSKDKITISFNSTSFLLPIRTFDYFFKSYWLVLAEVFWLFPLLLLLCFTSAFANAFCLFLRQTCIMEETCICWLYTTSFQQSYCFSFAKNIFSHGWFNNGERCDNSMWQRNWANPCEEYQGWFCFPFQKISKIEDTESLHSLRSFGFWLRSWFLFCCLFLSISFSLWNTLLLIN